VIHSLLSDTNSQKRANSPCYGEGFPHVKAKPGLVSKSFSQSTESLDYANPGPEKPTPELTNAAFERDHRDEGHGFHATSL
jgi:hypothetical protein